jgi:O-antigen ligase
VRLPWSQRVSTAEKAILLVATVSLLASVTNLVPFSALLAVPALVAPLLFLGRRSVPSLTFSLVVMLGYFMLWALLYHPPSLLEYGFYRRDGNVFITFAPLLLLSLLRLDIDLDRLVRSFVYVASALNGVFLVIYAITGGTIFFHQPGFYHFLFVAHNAAGGFLAVLTALSLGYYVAKRDRVFLFLTLLNLVGLFASDSRGSILGLIVACGIVLVLKGRLVRTVVAVIVVGHLVVVPWLYSVAPPAALHVESPMTIESDTFDALPRSYTVALRAFYLWPRAWHLFQSSPIIGTGFGSYNDLPYNLQGVRPVAEINRPVNVRHTDSHAHHTFLHVLAETGMIGLALLLVFLVRTRRFILGIPESALRQGLHLVFWIAVISSLTEHRLFTPSQMLPFTIVLGLAVARHEHRRWQLRRTAAESMLRRPLQPVGAGGGTSAGGAG